MSHYLLVANRTTGSAELEALVGALEAQDRQAQFSLLVPATPVHHRFVWDEDETLQVARKRAHEWAAAMRARGHVVTSSAVGDKDPVLAVRDDVRGHAYDAVVISTLRPGVSRWLRLDVISRLRRDCPHLRIVHVVSSSSDAGWRDTRAEATAMGTEAG
jgi:hypothetical protein